MKLHTVPVTIRFTGTNRDPIGVDIEFPDAPQGFNQDIALESQLRVIARVLVLATAASSENWARRLHTIGRRLHDPHQPRPLHMLARPGLFGFHRLARQHEGREYYF